MDYTDPHFRAIRGTLFRIPIRVLCAGKFNLVEHESSRGLDISAPTRFRRELCLLMEGAERLLAI